MELYINFDPQTQAGLRVRAGGLAVALEKIASKDAEPEVLFTTLPPSFNKGDHVLGAQWRHGELTIWHNEELLMTWKPTAEDRTFAAGAGALAAPGQTVKGLPSGVRVTATNVKLGARRAIPLSTIRFDDDFMRESGDGRWQPQSGRWELTGMAFPERSANPFALRATFTNDPPDTDTFYKGREREGDFGLGIMLSPYEGTLHIARISGGSAAARAGMQEDDIFVDIDGTAVDEQNGRFAHQLLARGFGNTIHLKMLRPGEKKLRDVIVTPEQYKWATPIVGTPIQPVSAPLMLNGDGLSMITTGERGWSDYAAEVSVKPLGSGGMGMAVAVLSRRDYVLFRWHGPSGRPAAGAVPPVRNDGPAVPFDKLELVRVVDGQETILAEKDGGYRPYEFYRLGMDWNGDKVQCLIDGNVVLSATVPGLKRGQLGLCAHRKAIRCFSTTFTSPPTVRSSRRRTHTNGSSIISSCSKTIWKSGPIRRSNGSAIRRHCGRCIRRAFPAKTKSSSSILRASTNCRWSRSRRRSPKKETPRLATISSIPRPIRDS